MLTVRITPAVRGLQHTRIQADVLLAIENAKKLARFPSVSVPGVPDGCTLSNPFKAEHTYPVAAGNPVASGKAGYSPSRCRNNLGERSSAPSP
jgi:hypothetical protein